MERPRVVIGIPHLGDLPGYFVDSLINVASTPPGAFSLVRIERMPVDQARNAITRTFLANPDATHLFFMDADMVFPARALARLIEDDKDVVGGTYFARTETPIPHAYNFDHNDEEGRTWYRSLAAEYIRWVKAHPEWKDATSAHVYAESADSLVRCDALATGCLLIKRAVIEAIAEPWFDFWPGHYGGEDFRFCERARKAGFEVWADFGVQCAHEVRQAFTGTVDFVETYDIGGPNEIDPNLPILVEVGPHGRKVAGNRLEVIA